MNAYHNNPTTTKLSIILCIVIALMLPFSIACSNGGDESPIAPAALELASESTSGETGESAVLGMYDITFDPSDATLDVTSSRDADTYINVTPLIPDNFVNYVINNWDFATNTIEMTMYITNPSQYDVYDVRVLFLRNSEDGPELLNSNDYTKHFNSYSCHEINPFRSFCKFEPDRIFISGSFQTEQFEIQFGGADFSFQLLIMAALPGNTEEAYEIVNQYVTGSVSSIQSVTVGATVNDHQDDIDQVYLDTTILTGGYSTMGPDGNGHWVSGPIYNSQGLAPGNYWFRIVADSANTDWDLIDMIEIEVMQEPWIKADYPLTTQSGSLDLGVVSDPSGPRDSQVLMADTSFNPCDQIAAYYPYYSGDYTYVASLDGLDPANPDYRPYPVWRIDAAEKGAFSFTNTNDGPYANLFGRDYFNYQVWSVFDANPQIHVNPAPDNSRYLHMTLQDDSATAWPVDVCDDFDGGQYALFTTGGDVTMTDLLLIGTMPDSYTHDRIKYVGNLNPWVGSGSGRVDPSRIVGIDTYVVSREGQFSAILYVLEDTPGILEVEVFSITDTQPGYVPDQVNHEMTISINNDLDPTALDCELLPANPEYEENASQYLPTLCVLTSQPGNSYDFGQIYLINAFTGQFLEELGTHFGQPPLFADCDVRYLDTDDSTWEIHVTWYDPSSQPYATVFTHVL